MSGADESTTATVRTWLVAVIVVLLLAGTAGFAVGVMTAGYDNPVDSGDLTPTPTETTTPTETPTATPPAEPSHEHADLEVNIEYDRFLYSSPRCEIKIEIESWNDDTHIGYESRGVSFRAENVSLMKETDEDPNLFSHYMLPGWEYTVFTFDPHSGEMTLQFEGTVVADEDEETCSFVKEGEKI